VSNKFEQYGAVTEFVDAVKSELNNPASGMFVCVVSICFPPWRIEVALRPRRIKLETTEAWAHYLCFTGSLATTRLFCCIHEGEIEVNHNQTEHIVSSVALVQFRRSVLWRCYFYCRVGAPDRM